MDQGVTDGALKQPAVLDVLQCQREPKQGFRRMHWQQTKLLKPRIKHSEAEEQEVPGHEER